MKGVLVALLAGGVATAQPSLPQAERYTAAEIARAFEQCRSAFALAEENERRFPMPRLEGAPYEGAPRGGEWLQACVLNELQGQGVELRPLV